MILIDKGKWNELENWTPALMEKKFNEEQKKADLKAVYLDYWIDQINQYLK